MAPGLDDPLDKCKTLSDISETGHGGMQGFEKGGAMG